MIFAISVNLKAISSLQMALASPFLHNFFAHPIRHLFNSVMASLLFCRPCRNVKNYSYHPHPTDHAS